MHDVHLLETAEKMHYAANRTMFMAPTNISHFNFSGNGVAMLYKNIRSINWYCPIKDEGKSYLPEIIFHSIWGTYGILEYMTGYMGWATRNQMGDAFKQMGTSTPAPFKPMSLLKFAKLSAANQTGLLSLSSNPIVGKNAFSG